jgi:hypothetical protein
MAVFPDRIVLKETTDTPASVITAIQPGGTDEIVPGELVVVREAGEVNLYTLDSDKVVTRVSGLQANPGVENLSELYDTEIPNGGYYSSIVSADFTRETGNNLYNFSSYGFDTNPSTNVYYSIRSEQNVGHNFSADNLIVDQTKRYDAWTFGILADTAPSSSAYYSLGGTATSTASGGGFSLHYSGYNRAIEMYFGDGTFESLAPIGAAQDILSDFGANEYVQWTVVIDWGALPAVSSLLLREARPSKVYIWANGALITNATVPAGDYIAQDSPLIRWCPSASNVSGYQYFDEFYFNQFDVFRYPIDQANFFDWDYFSNSLLTNTSNGSTLVYNTTYTTWEPGPNIDAIELDDLADVDYIQASEADTDYSSVSFLLNDNWSDGATTVTDTIQSLSSTSLGTDVGVVNDYAYSPMGTSVIASTSTTPYKNPQIAFANDTAFDLGSGDFTLEGWVLQHGDSTTPTYLFYYDLTGQNYYVKFTPGGNTVALEFYGVNDADGIGSTYSLGSDTATQMGMYGMFHHIAVTRVGSTLRGFVDGILLGSTTINVTLQSGSIGETMYIAYRTAPMAANGFRITKGVGRYTADFTPPTTYPTISTSTASGDVLVWNGTSWVNDTITSVTGGTYGTG